MLDFNEISFELKPIIDKYYLKYGEASCQHSFASSFCLQGKYNDYFCEKDNYLYIVRLGVSDEHKRVYLFPMGDKNDIQGVKNAVDNILDDAREHNKKVCFEDITESSMNILKEYYADRFTIDDNRDMYEYIYDINKVNTLQGSDYQSKRNLINKLVREYGDSMLVEDVSRDNLSAIDKYYKEWLAKHDSAILLGNEVKEFQLVIDNYDKLNMVGIVISVKDKIIGFNVGARISEDTYDGMIQKGDAE